MKIVCAGEDCGVELDRKDAFAVDEAKGVYLCLDCFSAMGQRMLSSSQAVVSGEKKKRLKKLVQEEMTDIIPREEVKLLVAEQLRRVLLKNVEPEDAYGTIANQVVALCGPAVIRYRIKMVRALRQSVETALDKEEEEARADLQKYIDLGIGGT